MKTKDFNLAGVSIELSRQFSVISKIEADLGTGIFSLAARVQGTGNVRMEDIVKTISIASQPGTTPKTQSEITDLLEQTGYNPAYALFAEYLSFALQENADYAEQAVKEEGSSDPK